MQELKECLIHSRGIQYSMSTDHGPYFTGGRLTLFNLDIFLQCIVKCKKQDLEKCIYSMIFEKQTMTTPPYMCICLFKILAAWKCHEMIHTDH